MVAGCPAFSAETALLRSVLAATDCYARTLGSQGYQALSANGTPVSLMLPGVLTLFVAFIGYRFLFGEAPGLRDGVLAMAKIGIVLSLTMNWPVFRPLVYDVVFQGPVELASAIARPIGIPVVEDGLVEGLQSVDAMLEELVLTGTGKPPEIREMTAGDTASQQRQLTDMQQRPPWDPGRDARMVAQARIVFLASVIAGLASVRLLAGLLLTLGPVFALFLLFDTTRGLFQGWARAVIGAALGMLAGVMLLGIELVLIAPWLMAIVAKRRMGISTPQVPAELLAITLACGLILIAALMACGRMARGFTLPSVRRLIPAPSGSFKTGQNPPTPPLPTILAPAKPRSRAIALADAVSAIQLREERLARAKAVPHDRNADAALSFPATPLPETRGLAFAPRPPASAARRARHRVSGAAGRRDQH